MGNSIPGFDEACSQESWERYGAYVAASERVCGIQLRQITPLDLARLNYARNPFTIGGVVSYPSAAQFIFILAYSPLTIEESLACVAPLTLDEISGNIDDFLAVTFRDKPVDSGGSDAPVACTTAWMEYRMKQSCGWDRERTLSTPLRVIWQQLRCWQSERGEVVVNRLSHPRTNEFLIELQRRVSAGEITQTELDKMNEPWLKSRSLN